MAEVTEVLLTFSRVRTARTGCEDGVCHIWNFLNLKHLGLLKDSRGGHRYLVARSRVQGTNAGDLID